LYLAVTAALAIATPALAHVENGDFEKGAANWTASSPAFWSVSFPAAGGHPNGHALIQSPFGNSQGTASISQSFDCGIPSLGLQCIIDFDYRLRAVDASPLTGRVKVIVDGALQFVSPPSNFIDWTTVTIAVPCGDHTISLGLEVDAGNNGWEALFDNVLAHCDILIPVQPNTWGSIKRVFD
jgi:hypothetical protein